MSSGRKSLRSAKAFKEVKDFKFSDLLSLGKLDFFTYGFFRLRFFIYCVFSGFMWHQNAPAVAIFAWFVWAQLEFLYYSIDLDDKFTSDWEFKLGNKIKRKGNGKR